MSFFQHAFGDGTDASVPVPMGGPGSANCGSVLQYFILRRKPQDATALS
jgi:hypothetical protein